MYPFPSKVDEGRDTEDTEAGRWMAELLGNKGTQSQPDSLGFLILGGTRREWGLRTRRELSPFVSPLCRSGEIL